MTVTIDLGDELFSFSSQQDWIEHGLERYSEAGAHMHDSLAIDAKGRIITSSRGFRIATQDQAYPVRVYQIPTETR